ncbi:DNA repair protein rhp41 [Termitomyces sp. J132]|nr:DNA repair protein rhp41 [Termitomyces sp. J132]
MASVLESDPSVEQESEDDFDWEEVPVPEHQSQAEQQEEHLEITIPAAGPRSKKVVTVSKFQGISHEERLRRIDCHKIHTVVLLVNAWVRNKWLNDELLQARLLSLTPLSLQNAFGMIHKSRMPDQNQRGRAFETAINNLVEWWSKTYFEVTPYGHIKNRTYDDIQAKLAELGPPPDPDGTLDTDNIEDVLGEESERIRSPKSLMKHALMASGSRDVSAQLFTALCRALGIPARLVVSLQSVPWQTHVGKPKPTRDNAFPVEGQRLDEAPVPKSNKAKGKEKAKPVIKLRKARSKGCRLGNGADSPTSGLSRPVAPDPRKTPPVFWTEVFSRPDGRWIPVDPIRSIVNKRKVFDPTPTSAPPPPENRMMYVLGLEEDGYARDVTRRYAKQFSAKIAKVQGGSSSIGGGGKARQAWWEAVLSIVTRPYRLIRDDVEDEELNAAQMTEGMPTTISGFKDHPIYVLARHLKQNQVIHPPDTPELGRFRGEAVYSRSAVVSLKTAENWMRSEGRMVKEGSQPLKMVKVRAGTINRMRELEVMKDELREAGEPSMGVGETMQGLYARRQTELYKPDPVIDGKVPKNNFGNIDLYVPSMLPRGAAHVPFKGVAKIAKKLGFDFAEAVTGFEFKKRRAFPVVEGVVVAQENEAVLLQVYWEAEQDAEEKARGKRKERVIKQWTRLIQGLRVRRRLQAQYVTNSQVEAQSHVQDNNHNMAIVGQPETPRSEVRACGMGSGGGFLVGADDVVQPFHLPKPKFQPVEGRVVSSSQARENMELPDLVGAEELSQNNTSALSGGTHDLGTLGMDSDIELEAPFATPWSLERVGAGVPKTMQQLAEDDAARQQHGHPKDDIECIDAEVYQPDRGPDKRGGIQTKLTSLRVNQKLSGTPSSSSSASTPASTSRIRPAAARRSGKYNSKSRKRTREDDTDDNMVNDLSEPSPRKRVTRASQKSEATVPAPTRTLRPRMSKTAAQLKEAEE